MSIYPVAIYGTLVDPLQVLVWFHWSMIDHGIVRPALFLGTIFVGFNWSDFQIINDIN